MAPPSESTRSGIKLARSSPSAVVVHAAAGYPAVPSVKLAGRRSFPVAASIFWNTLTDDVQSAPSVSSFRRQLKTFCFTSHFPTS